MSAPLSPLRLPVPPAEPPPAGFPVIASIAPLAAAAVIWGLTGSVFALVFAGLSPVVALASVLDGRRLRRRTRRRDALDYASSLAALRSLAQEQNAALCAERWERAPSAASILAAHDQAVYWPSDGVTQVSIGSGSIDGGLRLDGADTTPEHRALALEVATLTGAPIVIDAIQGIGIVGNAALARALARSLVIQLCTALPPTRCGFGAPATGWEWASVLPQRDSPAKERELEVWEEGERHASVAGERLLIAVATSVTALPPGCDTVVQVHGPDRAEIVRSNVQPRGLSFRPELISTAEAGRFAAVLQHQATSAGLLGRHSLLPTTVTLSSLSQRTDDALTGLSCTIGRGEQGEAFIDLVRNGPHAVVGGTTGSGKSELLVTWILAMAATRTVRQVNFLLVDFKGGAAFGPLVALPHCVGLVTDLDAGEAARALASLSAELRHRERVLREVNARAIDDPAVASALPRLVIVVDEFATMLEAYPALHALFVDIAARGRSLGVHLILCTQRPAGVVRDALLANCSLRVSLRVNNRADSLAVLGTDAAAALSPAAPGRALVDTGDAAVSLCQIATSDQRDLAEIIAAHRDLTPVRRPWLSPLPTQLTTDLMVQLTGAGMAATESSPGALTLGLIDEPEHQRYRIADYDPDVDGHLLVVGAARSGKSSALALIEAAARAAHVQVESVGADVERAWDLLESAHRRSAGPAGDPTAPDGLQQRGARPLLLLFDDFDSVLARWEPEHRLGALDLLTAVLRDGAAAGITCVVSVQRVNNGLQLLPTLCPSRLLLRASGREDYLAAGGLPERFDSALPPGGGLWQDRRVQLVAPPAAQEHAGTAASSHDASRSAPAVVFSFDDAPTRSVIVVAGAPAQCAERYRRASPGVDGVVEIGGAAAARPEHLEIGRAAAVTVFVGDAETWQGEWALLQTLRSQALMIFDGCSLADFRQISRRRLLPPPLAPSSGHLWVLTPDGTVGRGAMPGATNSSDSQLANTEIDAEGRGN